MTKASNTKFIFFTGVVGNVLDHYDTALYVYLVPFIAATFFNFDDPVIALLAGYGVKSTAIITRPIGSLFFSYLASKWGAKNTLVVTLLGVAITTFIISIIPGYQSIGIIAPITLILVRMVQGFFASGEYIVSAVFIFNYAKAGRYAQANSYYLCSHMGGIAIASSVAAIVSASNDPNFNWRYAFAIGLFTGIIGLILRLTVIVEKSVIDTASDIAVVKATYINFSKIIIIACLSSFSYVTYSVPFVFLIILYQLLVM